MSDLPDPQESLEQTVSESAFPAGDKRIVFGARKPTEEVSALTGIPLIIEAPFPYERTLQWLPIASWEETDVETKVAAHEEGDQEPSSPAPVEAVENDSNHNPSATPFALEGDGNTNVVVSQEVLIKVNEHVSQSLDRELGGFLLGNRYRCTVTGCDYVIIDQYSVARFTESSEVRLAFTHEAWAQISDELSGKFLGKLLIGWYHSHPHLDVFLSTHDMDIQTERFAEPWMVALVLEPAKHHGGFFCSRGGHINPHSPVEFFELLERNSRDSVIAWENYRALDPSTSSTPVLSTTNTATSSNTSQELLEVRAKQAEKLPAKPRRRGRLFVYAVVLLVLLGAAAFGVRNRKRIVAWWQHRMARSTATETPQPSPSPEQTPAVQQAAEQPAAVPQPTAVPEGSPASSPSPSPTSSPTPAEGPTQPSASTTQPAKAAAVEQPAKRPTRRAAAKGSNNKK